MSAPSTSAVGDKLYRVVLRVEYANGNVFNTVWRRYAADGRDAESQAVHRAQAEWPNADEIIATARLDDPMEMLPPGPYADLTP